MNKLIKIKGTSAEVVSAKELYKSLEVKEPFEEWILKMLEYGFVENEDYQYLSDEEDYALTQDCSYEIRIIQDLESGRRLRKYLIACESILKDSETKQDKRLEYEKKIRDFEEEAKLIESERKALEKRLIK